mmetsp:Transcript_90362/g.258546  ORF Transcript_90362/g.258546 Transcript_90362/m.258546 type:complete len:398 (+) Transcript_90362:575-1768(+)
MSRGPAVRVDAYRPRGGRSGAGGGRGGGGGRHGDVLPSLLRSPLARATPQSPEHLLDDAPSALRRRPGARLGRRRRLHGRPARRPAHVDAGRILGMRLPGSGLRRQLGPQHLVVKTAAATASARRRRPDLRGAAVVVAGAGRRRAELPLQRRHVHGVVLGLQRSRGPRVTFVHNVAAPGQRVPARYLGQLQKIEDLMEILLRFFGIVRFHGFRHLLTQDKEDGIALCTQLGKPSCEVKRPHHSWPLSCRVEVPPAVRDLPDCEPMIPALAQEGLRSGSRVLHQALCMRVLRRQQLEGKLLQCDSQHLNAEVSTVCRRIAVVGLSLKPTSAAARRSIPSIPIRRRRRGAARGRGPAVAALQEHALLLVELHTDLSQVPGAEVRALQEVVETMDATKTA